ncbi:hypothetical protein FQZ97_840380 [compost metagenome]
MIVELAHPLVAGVQATIDVFNRNILASIGIDLKVFQGHRLIVDDDHLHLFKLGLAT